MLNGPLSNRLQEYELRIANLFDGMNDLTRGLSVGVHSIARDWLKIDTPFTRANPLSDIVPPNLLLERFPNISYEERFFISEDETKVFLREFRQPEYTEKWALVLHGFGDSSIGVQDRVAEFVARGYNVITPDARGHGATDGLCAGMGWLERRDILEICTQVVSSYPASKIVLYGVSMGGAGVMMAAGEPLPKNVKCGVADCGYTSLHDQAQHLMKPAGPIKHLGSFLADRYLEGIATYNTWEASSVAQLRNCTIPMLFIHGTEDDFVPFWMLQKNYDACASEIKEIWAVEGAGHGDAAYIEGGKYWDRVDQFVSQSFADYHM